MRFQDEADAASKRREREGAFSGAMSAACRRRVPLLLETKAIGGGKKVAGACAEYGIAYVSGDMLR